MQEPKNTQSLEHLVEFLELRKVDANSSASASIKKVYIYGMVFGAGLFGLSYDMYDLAILNYIVKIIGIAGVGVGVAGTILNGAKFFSDYHRGNLLSDRIAEIKQSPDYKEYESSKGTVNGSHV